jgi:hypothetical protein
MHGKASLGVAMAKGDSGRVVIEVDPELKRELYAILARNGSTLKDWFVQRANNYVANSVQPSLAFTHNKEEKVNS